MKPQAFSFYPTFMKSRIGVSLVLDVRRKPFWSYDGILIQLPADSCGNLRAFNQMDYLDYNGDVYVRELELH